MMRLITWALILSSLLLSAAIFGFFYAWICSTMWGLDAADPRVAIAAMQAMNGSVRNATFAPAFFGAPVLLIITGWVLWRREFRWSAALFVLSSAVYFFFGLILTMAVNVPMNEALATIRVPESIEEARQIWSDYSPTWQVWNQIRTVASGLSFLIAVIGVLSLPRWARVG